MQGPVSIHVASSDGANVPSVARALGCRIDDGAARLCVFLPAEQARDVLADIRACARVAVVFSRPTTHRTIQVKGNDARVGPIDGHDVARIRAYVDAFVREIHSIGHAEDVGRALLDFDAAGVVAVTFTPEAAFRQTPGPDAGAPIAR